MRIGENKRLDIRVQGLRGTISRNVVRHMNDSGMTFRDLAELLSVGVDYARTKIQEGRWTLEDIERLSGHFHVEPSQMVTDRGDR